MKDQNSGLTPGELFLANYLFKRYGTPVTSVRAMIKDGKFAKSILRYAEIARIYTLNFEKTQAVSKAVAQTATSMNISERMVYRAKDRFKGY